MHTITPEEKQLIIEYYKQYDIMKAQKKQRSVEMKVIKQQLETSLKQLNVEYWSQKLWVKVASVKGNNPQLFGNEMKVETFVVDPRTKHKTVVSTLVGSKRKYSQISADIVIESEQDLLQANEYATRKAIAEKINRSPSQVSRKLRKLESKERVKQQAVNTVQIKVTGTCCRRHCLELNTEVLQQKLSELNRHRGSKNEEKEVIKLLTSVHEWLVAKFPEVKLKEKLHMCVESCQKLLNINWEKRKRLVDTINCNGIAIPHGRKGKRPSNSMPIEDEKKIKDYLEELLVPDPTKKSLYYPKDCSSLKSLAELINCKTGVKVTGGGLNKMLHRFYDINVSRMPRDMAICSDYAQMT
jgi:DNA-binding Lrp family transcriptional regulator